MNQCQWIQLKWIYIILIDSPPEHAFLSEPLANAQAHSPSLNDIKILYHPHSGRATEHIRLDDYRSRVSGSVPKTNPSFSESKPPLEEPWYPFRSRLDFEVADFALNTHLNKTETETLLSLIQRCIKNLEQHTLKDYKEIAEYWDLARIKIKTVSAFH